jgi:hypothetical protein
VFAGKPNETKLKGADPETFVIFDQKGYAKDKNQVYFAGTVVPGADASSFEVLRVGEYDFATYGQDANQIFSGGEIVAEADPETFELMTHAGYAKDAHSAFHNGMLISGADVTTFETFSDDLAKDANDYYTRENPIQVCDMKTFTRTQDRAAGTIWGYDSECYYTLYQKRPITDPGTFEVLSHSVAKDAANVYVFEETIEGADPATFVLVDEWEVAARDKNRCYNSNYKPTECPTPTAPAEE